MVHFKGDSRIGKTVAVTAWRDMNPGKARLVKTPSSCCERSFLEALADAVGLSRGLDVTLPKLRCSLEYIFRHAGGLLLIFDESHFLTPTRYTDKTMPFRLNYIRGQLLENGRAVALIETQQHIGGAAVRFLKTTGYNMAQWNGRIMRTTPLTKEVSEADIFAVVNLHFPGLHPACAKRIVAAALQSDSYLFAVEKIAKNARAVARERQGEIDLADIESAITLAGFQTSAAPSGPAAAKAKAGKQVSHFNSPIQAAPSLPAPARSVTPLSTESETVTT
jgi:hypothetical protein